MSASDETSRPWQVAVPAPLRRLYTYNIPAALGVPVIGARVLVPFGRRRVTGFLVRPNTDPLDGDFKIKDALELPDDVPALPEALVDFLLEAAAYYMHPPGEVFRAALPAGMHAVERKGALARPRVAVRKEEILSVRSDAVFDVDQMERRAPKRAALLREVVTAGELRYAELRGRYKGARETVRRLEQDGILTIDTVDALPDRFFSAEVERDHPLEPTLEQTAAIDQVGAALDEEGYRGFLLHGVTGSGKTEVYLQLIERNLQQGRGALVLVPEIALTPQLIGRFRARFGDELAVWHSGLTDRERFDQWQLLRTGRLKMAVGVRSAVFAPVANLGLIIVDEEHDGSFKQDRGFAYNARDLALLRAARLGATALLGTATPSLESFNNTQTGKLDKIELTSRATAAPMPGVEVVDLKRHRSGPLGQNIVSAPLHAAIEENLTRGEQTILFLNRRGFAPSIQCRDCGEIVECTSCAVSMTYHRRPPRLICHYCGHDRPLPSKCPKCNGEELKNLGAGTQKVELTLQELYPGARIGRLDRDVGGSGGVERVLDALRAGEIDILVGTQMVTKGHDFPRVTLVGVVMADVGLHMPDFRAAERGFQLLTQVAGRAGRSELPGRVLIQTYNPDHPSIACAREHDFASFATLETSIRRELGYPPFGRLAALRINGGDHDRVEATARELAAHLREAWYRRGQPAVSLLGPAPSPLAQIQNRYRWQILLRSERGDLIRSLIDPLLPYIERPPSGTSIRIDIDPLSML